MSYIKTVWKARKGSNLNRFEKSQETNRSVMLYNAPNSITEHGTPFSVENMNKIEEGIYNAHEMIAAEEQKRILGDKNTLETAKSFTDETAAGIRAIINDLAGLPEWDENNFIFTFKSHSGAALEVDLPLEALAKDIDYDSATKEIIIIKQDGTEIHIDVSDLVDIYLGSIGEHIQIEVDSGNVIKAKLLKGSITEAELSAALLAKIEGKLDKAARGAADGVASLDENGKVPMEQLPDEVAGDFSAIAEKVDAHAADVDAHKNLFAGVVKHSEKGAAGGVASLDGNGKVPMEQLPSSNCIAVFDTTAHLSQAANIGDAALVGTGTLKQLYIWR
jgi:hypothetical protein